LLSSIVNKDRPEYGHVTRYFQYDSTQHNTEIVISVSGNPYIMRTNTPDNMHFHCVFV